MKKNILRYAPALLLITFFILWSFVFHYSSPESIIDWVGVENAYLLIFILALMGGFTTFSGIPYHVVLVALAVGGLNPFILGIAASFGVMIGDSTSYYIGYGGRLLVPEKIQKWLERLSIIKEKYPRLLPVVFLCYGSLLPFSNDVITIPMGLLRHPFWRVFIPLGIGNIIFNISLAFLAAYAYEFLQATPFL